MFYDERQARGLNEEKKEGGSEEHPGGDVAGLKDRKRGVEYRKDRRFDRGGLHTVGTTMGSRPK